MPVAEASGALQTPALRLGITGARNLPPAELPRIQAEMDSALALIRTTLAEAQPNTAKLLLITPLARGADRLAAQSALQQGIPIFVPMPFAQAEYEKDFVGVPDDSYSAAAMSAGADLGEFTALLQHAVGSVELDGHRGSDGSGGEAYEAVGRYVVQHCDLLIAIWNGQPGNGRGGTAEIVQFAVEQGRPMWWINAAEAHAPRWVEAIGDLQQSEAEAPASQAEAEAPASQAESKLKAWLRHCLAAK